MLQKPQRPLPLMVRRALRSGCRPPEKAIEAAEWSGHTELTLLAMATMLSCHYSQPMATPSTRLQLPPLLLQPPLPPMHHARPQTLNTTPAPQASRSERTIHSSWPTVPGGRASLRRSSLMPTSDHGTPSSWPTPLAMLPWTPYSTHPMVA